MSRADLVVEDSVSLLLEGEAVPMGVLHDRYGPVLELVRGLLGVVPNCDRYLEIWPPAFRTYNIMVPNLLNLPLSVFGLSKPKASVVGLGMYVASRAAECPYCSAHSCSFALRRGATPEKVAQALVGGDAAYSEQELATIAVARSLARVPCELTTDERQALLDAFPPGEAEWVVGGIVMMGFLNKCMDALGVPLETSIAAEVSTTLGAGFDTGKAGRALDPRAPATAPPSSDSAWTKLRLVPHMPGALKLDGRWQSGVPARWPEVGAFLHACAGHDFPVLRALRHPRLVRAIAAMLRENLDPKTTVVGLPFKMLAGAVYAAVIGDDALAADVRAMAPRFGVDPAELEEATAFARGGDLPARAADPVSRAALVLARASSSSPARIDADVVGSCRTHGLPAAAIVEVVCWLAVLQMLHRLTSFYAPSSAAGAESDA